MTLEEKDSLIKEQGETIDKLAEHLHEATNLIEGIKDCFPWDRLIDAGYYTAEELHLEREAWRCDNSKMEDKLKEKIYRRVSELKKFIKMFDSEILTARYEVDNDWVSAMETQAKHEKRIKELEEKLREKKTEKDTT